MKIINGTSHLDHGLTGIHTEWLAKQINDMTWDGVLTVTLHLPNGMWGVPCALYGPAMGDPPVAESDVHYAPRGERTYNSRLVPRDTSQLWKWPRRMVRDITAIVGPHDGDPAVLYTAFGGPLAPHEINDPKRPADKHIESINFWCAHALTTYSTSVGSGR